MLPTTIITPFAQVMSSREIAELTGKRHGDVCRDIRKILEELEIDERKFASIFLDNMNREQSEFQLPKRETIILTTLGE
jgi:phage regulator Rha-like protein